MSPFFLLSGFRQGPDQLIEEVGDLHRVALTTRLVRELSGGGPLPERLSLFALQTLPPLYVGLLGAIAGAIPVTLYLHSPTEHYWADLVSSRERARARLSRPDDADYYETGHELLASWGRQGQVFQDLLLAVGALSLAGAYYLGDDVPVAAIERSLEDPE